MFTHTLVAGFHQHKHKVHPINPQHLPCTTLNTKITLKVIILFFSVILNQKQISSLHSYYKNCNQYNISLYKLEMFVNFVQWGG